MGNNSYSLTINGSFTLHGIGNGRGTTNDGFIYYAMYCSHYTGTGTGKGTDGFQTHFTSVI